jgi:predicted MFS family arabinose efflux permease
MGAAVDVGVGVAVGVGVGVGVDERASAGSQSRPAHREPAYLRYVAGQAISVLGDQVWYVALSWSAVQLASPAVVGVILAVSALPRLAFLLLGGAIVDRHDPRRLMIGSDILRGAVALGAAGVAVWRPSIGLLVVVALLFGAADALFLPAAATVPPRLLGPAQLTSGAALSTLSNRAALTLGAPVGGLLVAFGGLSYACVVNAATFGVSVLALWSVRPRPAAPSPATETARIALGRGLRYLAQHRVLRALLTVSLLTNLGFVGPMNVGLALVSADRGWGASGIGAMLAGFGAGAVAGSLTMLRVRVRGGVGIALAACTVLEAIAVFSVALAPRLAVAVIATAAAGLASGPLGVLITSLGQARTADAFRGRVGSVNSLANLGITPIAIAVMGAAADWFGTVPAFAGSGLLEVAAAIGCLAVPDLRGARLPSRDPALR